MIKYFFAVLALMLAIILAVVAGVAIGSLLPAGGATDAVVRASGLGVVVQNVNTSTTTAVARRAAGLKQLPQVTDQMLADVVNAVIENARRGDVNAAVFLFDLSAAQKALAAKQPKSAGTTQPATGE
jgi:hypothetical protein